MRKIILGTGDFYDGIKIIPADWLPFTRENLETGETELVVGCCGNGTMQVTQELYEAIRDQQTLEVD